MQQQKKEEKIVLTICSSKLVYGFYEPLMEVWCPFQSRFSISWENKPRIASKHVPFWCNRHFCWIFIFCGLLSIYIYICYVYVVSDQLLHTNGLLRLALYSIWRMGGRMKGVFEGKHRISEVHSVFLTHQWLSILGTKF